MDPFHQIVFHKISCLQKDENVIISLRYVFKNASNKFYIVFLTIFFKKESMYNIIQYNLHRFNVIRLQKSLHEIIILRAKSNKSNLFEEERKKKKR